MIKWIKGMDVSSLEQVEQCGGKFFDHGTKEDPLVILKRYGMNFARLRLWNDPKSPKGKPYGGGNTDLPVVIKTADRLKRLNIPWLLDFHYSDFWADPGKQTMPKAWQGMNLRDLENEVYKYTYDVLQYFSGKENLPAIVAPGNELTNGLLWPVGRAPDFDAITRLVGAGIRAVRDIKPSTKIMIHLDNGGNNNLYRKWFDSWIKEDGPDFDYIGLSYYPFWHGTLLDLKYNMHDLAVRYGKPMIVAETSAGFTLQSYQSYEKLSEQNRKGPAANEKIARATVYPMTPEGQSSYMRDLMTIIAEVPNSLGKGFFYWEPGLLPVPGTDWALPAGTEYIGEKGPGGNEWANQALFDYDGRVLPALKEIQDFVN